jgi:drug/metabolite transporter (DMT)-like permease
MTGALCAAASGVGFGVFQSLNRRAVAQMDLYVATFLQLVVAAAVLVVLSFTIADVGTIANAPAGALAWFAVGGFVHFFVGWTLLNASQQRVGAARTSPLIATTPLFGVAVALATLGEVPGPLAWTGIVLITVGAYAVGLARAGGGWPRLADVGYGIGCAVAWSVSPVFIRRGLEGLDSPLLGLTIGMVVSLVAFAVLLALRCGRVRGRVEFDALSFKLAAGVFVALSTWGRWVAVDLTAVGIVLALNLLSVPIVLVLSPLLMGRHVERVDLRVWGGAALVVFGSLLLIARSL